MYDFSISGNKAKNVPIVNSAFHLKVRAPSVDTHRLILPLKNILGMTHLALSIVITSAIVCGASSASPHLQQVFSQGTKQSDVGSGWQPKHGPVMFTSWPPSMLPKRGHTNKLPFEYSFLQPAGCIHSSILNMYLPLQLTFEFKCKLMIFCGLSLYGRTLKNSVPFPRLKPIYFNFINLIKLSFYLKKKLFYLKFFKLVQSFSLYFN